jgi:hypothetical protein
LITRYYILELEVEGKKLTEFPIKDRKPKELAIEIENELRLEEKYIHWTFFYYAPSKMK